MPGDGAQRSGPLAAEVALVFSHWSEWIARVVSTRDVTARKVRLAVNHAAQPKAIREEAGEIREVRRRVGHVPFSHASPSTVWRRVPVGDVAADGAAA